MGNIGLHQWTVVRQHCHHPAFLPGTTASKVQVVLSRLDSPGIHMVRDYRTKLISFC